jgi:nucleoside-diphosphate-sugar epimerase
VKLIFGCGYLGRRVADLWLSEGAEVFAVSRSPDRARALTEAGVKGLVGDVLSPDSLKSLPPTESVVFAIGHDRASKVSIRELYVEGLRNTLLTLPPGVERFIYVSSTGVYGQSDGSWVDEQSNCTPLREGGRACLEAERILQQHPLGASSVVLRMAGIYGPGRIPRRRRLQAGLPIAAPATGFLNLIHVDDAARAVLAAERVPKSPRLVCVSDGNPVVRGEYYGELARLLGAAPPQFMTPPADTPVAQRASSSKRVRNSRLLTELGVRLRYPSYREGLAAIIAAERTG